jgi:LysR family glycine cleavage system transcriptional activator
MKYWQHIPPLKAMLAVEATARLGSFSKAASELNVTQSAVSHLVNQAEVFVNTQLFQRQLRPVQLTPEGRRLVDAIVAGLNIIRAKARRCSDLKTRTRSRCHATSPTRISGCSPG